MLKHETLQSRHNWERWDWLWSVFFYLALAIVSGLYFVSQPATGERLQIILLLVVLVLLHTIAIVSPMRGKDGSTRASPVWMRVLYCALLVTLWVALAATGPVFYLLLFCVFPELGRWLEWWWMAVFAILVTAAYFLLEFSSLAGGMIWIFLLTATGISVFGYWLNLVVNQSYSRHELIQQLQQTRAELASSERKAGVLQERQRLAHEIHDTLAQGFTSIVLHLEAADQVLPTDVTTAQQHLDYARSTARESLEQARRVINDLRPKTLDESNLIESITRFHTEFAARTNIETTFSVTGELEPLHPDIEVTLYRATQEALNNVRKHAAATEVTITLSYMGDTIMLDVQDNGVGIEVGQTTHGYGLTAMRQRVQAFAGSVELESAENEGTTLVVSIPLS